MMSFLLRMDTTAHHCFLFCITPSIALHHYLRRCFTSWKGPDIACFSDAQFRSFIPEVFGSTRPSCWFHTTHIRPHLKTVDPRSAIGCRQFALPQNDDRRQEKTITPDRFDDRDHKAVDARPHAFVGLRAPCSPCDEQRGTSPQGPVHLVL